MALYYVQGADEGYYIEAPDMSKALEEWRHMDDGEDPEYVTCVHDGPIYRYRSERRRSGEALDAKE